MKGDSFDQILCSISEALRSARGDHTAVTITEFVDGKPVDVTTREIERSLRELSEAATPGAWTWEAEQDGLMTLYAGRAGNRHGLNLFGRMEPDANGQNNINLIAALVNAYRAGRLKVVDKEDDA